MYLEPIWDPEEGEDHHDRQGTAVSVVLRDCNEGCCHTRDLIALNNDQNQPVDFLPYRGWKTDQGQRWEVLYYSIIIPGAWICIFHIFSSPLNFSWLHLFNSQFTSDLSWSRQRWRWQVGKLCSSWSCHSPDQDGHHGHHDHWYFDHDYYYHHYHYYYKVN